MYKLQVIWKEQRKVQDNRDVFVICTSYLGGILYIVLIKREILTSTINQKKSFKPHVFFFQKEVSTWANYQERGFLKSLSI